MDVSTFVGGYLVGLAIGVAVTLWWTHRYGRVSLKSLRRCWRDIAGSQRRAVTQRPFTSRRNGDVTPD